MSHTHCTPHTASYTSSPSESMVHAPRIPTNTPDATTTHHNPSATTRRYLGMNPQPLTGKCSRQRMFGGSLHVMTDSSADGAFGYRTPTCRASPLRAVGCCLHYYQPPGHAQLGQKREAQGRKGAHSNRPELMSRASRAPLYVNRLKPLPPTGLDRHSAPTLTLVAASAPDLLP